MITNQTPPAVDLDDYYIQTMKYLFSKYHNYPANILGLPVTPKEQEAIAYYQGMAAMLVTDPASA